MILIFNHPGLPNMNRNISRKTKCMNINQNMQNVPNKYCVPVEYVSKHYVKVMTTTLKLASFVEIYLLG